MLQLWFPSENYRARLTELKSARTHLNSKNISVSQDRIIQVIPLLSTFYLLEFIKSVQYRLRFCKTERQQFGIN